MTLLQIADSFHMLNDLISLMVALWAIRLASQRHQNQSKYSYGWQRAEILGALLNGRIAERKSSSYTHWHLLIHRTLGVFLLALCFTILMEAIQRFIHMEPMTNPVMVLITGGAGLIANILGLFLFHGTICTLHACIFFFLLILSAFLLDLEHGHGHNHGHDHNHNHSDHESTGDLEPHRSDNHQHHQDHNAEGSHLNMKGVRDDTNQNLASLSK